MPPAPHNIIEPTTEPIELSGAPAPLEDDAPFEHEALVGDELPDRLIEKLPTIATLGDTPFEHDGEEVEHHKIVATEIVPDPVASHDPEPIVSTLCYVEILTHVLCQYRNCNVAVFSFFILLFQSYGISHGHVTSLSP